MLYKIFRYAGYRMKLLNIKNIEGNEILGKDILSNDGKVLLSRGTELKKDLKFNLITNGVYWIYVEDDNLSDITDDKYLGELKKTALENMPNIFNELISSHIPDSSSLKYVENLIDYIKNQGDLNTNLYEVKTYDNYTYVHCVDTAIMATFFGVSLHLSDDELKQLGTAAILHDIGKTMIPNSIINKDGLLTKNEFEIIKKHSLFGKVILQNNKFISESIIDAVTQHHEKYDGSGYPYGLKGDQICYFAKIISICDVFTAISANRSYRKRFAPIEAYEYVLSGSGSSFDKNLVETFKNTFAVYPLGSCLKLTNGIEGYVVKQNKYFPDRPIVRITYDSKTKKSISPYEIDLLNNTSIGINDLVI